VSTCFDNISMLSSCAAAIAAANGQAEGGLGTAGTVRDKPAAMPQSAPPNPGSACRGNGPFLGDDWASRTGPEAPSFDTIAALVKVLQVAPAELFGADPSAITGERRKVLDRINKLLALTSDEDLRRAQRVLAALLRD
jgi:hypothetical protein